MFSGLYYIFFYYPKQKLISLHIKTYQEAKEICDESEANLKKELGFAKITGDRQEDAKRILAHSELMESLFNPKNTRKCIDVQIDKLGFNPSLVMKTVVENKSSY